MACPELRLACLTLFVGGCAAPRPLDGRSAYAVDTEPAAEAWRRAAVEAVSSPFALIESAGKLPPAVRGDSAYWAERFLAPAARPLEHAEATVEVRIATERSPDLLRYRFKLGTTPVIVLESATFTFVAVEHRAIPGPVEIAGVAESLLDVKGHGHDWVFAPPTSHGGELRFSTGAEVDAWSMRSWADRVDGGIVRGLLYFLLFKKNPERVGYDNAQRWFPNEFRKHFRIL